MYKYFVFFSLDQIKNLQNIDCIPILLLIIFFGNIHNYCDDFHRTTKEKVGRIHYLGRIFAIQILILLHRNGWISLLCLFHKSTIQMVFVKATYMYHIINRI